MEAESGKVGIKRKSTSASLSHEGQDTKQTSLKNNFLNHAHQKEIPDWNLLRLLRLVFTNDGVGVVIRSTERYDLAKIKATESEEEYRCYLRLRAYDLVKTRLLES